MWIAFDVFPHQSIHRQVHHHLERIDGTFDMNVHSACVEQSGKRAKGELWPHVSVLCKLAVQSWFNILFNAFLDVDCYSH